MSNYRDPYALQKPESISHEANKIFMKLIDDGYEVFHLYKKFYFFKKDKDLIPFRTISGMKATLVYLKYLPYWRKRVQYDVCSQLLQKCKAVAKPWMPLPVDPRKITADGTKPTKIDYGLYMQDVVYYGMHQTPDGTHEVLYNSKKSLPLKKRGRKPKAATAGVTAPQVQTGASKAVSGTSKTATATGGPQAGTPLPADPMPVDTITNKNKEQ